MNMLRFLTPKHDVEYLYDDFSLRQALEKMEIHNYQAVPIINRNGNYMGTITEGDLLWFIKDQKEFDLNKAEIIPLRRVNHKKDYKAVSLLAPLEDIVKLAISQNFVPVVDDQQIFIGIIRRQVVISYFYERNFKQGE
ncbi:MAG TPA: CBS domain-containing protein [Firmicutes bacterium]|nr:CBS domain-containing protein [Bacillota bacterium]